MALNRARVMLALALCPFACAPRASTDTAGPETPGTSPPTWQAGAAQACQLTLAGNEGRRLAVDGNVTSHEVGEDLELSTFSFNDRHVAFALRPTWQPWFPRSESATLYTIGCDAPYPKTAVLTEEGVDFGHAAMAPGGKTLFYSARLARALDMATMTSKTLTEPISPSVTHGCHANKSVARDLVERWDVELESLVIHRYHPCGLDGHWQADEYVLSGTAANPIARRMSPVATIAADGDGRVWLGDGGRCETPGLQDPQSRGVVWRSDDAGATWTALRFANDKVEPGEYTTATGVSRVVVGSNPGEIVLSTSVCYTSGVGMYGGLLFQSTDGGRTWNRLPVPDGFADIDLGDGVVDFELVKSNFNHIRAWPHRPGEADRVAWDTRDGGKSWVINSDSPQGPRAYPREISVRGKTLRATPFGLMNGSEIVFRSIDQQR